MSKTWSETYSVHTYEMDRHQRASVRAVCGYLIETAGRHTHAIGYSIPQLLEQGRSWFFSRFLLRMDSYPGWQEKITVETWPPGSQKLLALRDWRLFCAQQPIGLGTSGWLMIDIRNRRPLRSESYPDWKRFCHPERTIAHTFGRLPALEDKRVDKSAQSEKQRFRVRFSDVDINGHANYLSYIDWILETVPPTVRDERQIAEMEVHFLREVNFGEELESSAQRIEDGMICPVGRDDSEAEPGTQFLHVLVRKQDQGELVRARTVWKPLTPG
jgi:medium-chain acyl-[acyl-carrier-protein] hydrolase